MNRFKTLALGVVTLTASLAHASFEMMMFIEGNRIVRYDPENRVQLGSFGAGELGSYSGGSIAADPVNRGVVAVLNGDGGIRRFNAFTGRYLGGVHTGISPFYANGPLRLEVLGNGNFLVAGYSSNQISRIYSGTTGAQLADMSPYGSSYWAMDSVVGSDGNIYTLNRLNSGGTYYYFTFSYTNTGTYLGYTNLGTSSYDNRFVSIGQAGNKIIISGNDHYNAVIHNNGVAQTITYATWSTWYGGGATGDLAWAHSRTYMHQWWNNSGSFVNRLNYYDPVMNHLTNNTVDLPYTTQLGSMTIVTAPEPGTLAALAAGFGLLLRKRKRV